VRRMASQFEKKVGEKTSVTLFEIKDGFEPGCVRKKQVFCWRKKGTGGRSELETSAQRRLQVRGDLIREIKKKGALGVGC